MDIEITEDQIQAELQRRRIAKSGAKKTNPLPSVEPAEDDNTPIRHYLHPKVKSIIASKCNLYMVGAAGSGKSKTAEIVAEELNLPYSAPPIGRETTIAQLFGYFNASGEYVRTPIRERVENGGVLHLEEIDFASPAVGTSLNALTANQYVGFPDQVIKRHENCIIVASANTFGTGATAQYIGSQGLNAATLDRFVFLRFPYDLKMEKRIAPNTQWCFHVQEIRRKVHHLGLKHVVSPRATIDGGKLINGGDFTWEEVEQMVLFKGLDELTIAKIRTTIPQE